MISRWCKFNFSDSGLGPERFRQFHIYDIIALPAKGQYIHLLPADQVLECVHDLFHLVVDLVGGEILMVLIFLHSCRNYFFYLIYQIAVLLDLEFPLLFPVIPSLFK